MRTRSNLSLYYWRRGRFAFLVMVVVVGLVACGNGFAPASDGFTTRSLDAMKVSARLEPHTPSEYAYFASSIAVDEGTVVIGAWGEQDRGRNTGAVYVFDLGQQGWQQQARLMAPAAKAGTRFGHSVAIDGDTILVGAIYDDTNGFRSGAVFVFERVNGTWLERGMLEPTVHAEDAFFGSSVALDEYTAIVGASGPNARVAYVFERASDGWYENAILAPHELERDTRFGTTVDISDDRLIVGAPTVDVDLDDDHVSEGFAYVYRRSGGIWVEDAVLTSQVSAGPEFGGSVAISGKTVVVGAPGASERVHVFELRDAEWMPVANLGSGFDGEIEHFGSAVALEHDTIVVGAPGRDRHAGTAYIFVRESGQWKSYVRITPPHTGEAIELAGTVALSHGTVLLGASGDDGGGTAAGAAYAFSNQ